MNDFELSNNTDQTEIAENRQPGKSLLNFSLTFIPSLEMNPSKLWFPTNFPMRADWYANFKKQFADLAAGLGFTPADVTIVTEDNNVMQFLAGVIVEMEAFTDAVRQYRLIISGSKIGEPTPEFPTMPALVLPNVVPTGIYQRLVELVERIRVAPTFTLEIGAMLGINPVQPPPHDPTTMKPTIKVTASFDNYKFDATVTRKKMSGFQVQIRRMDSEVWTNTVFGTTSPIAITVNPTTPGQPERLQVRAILYKQNEPVGQPSDPVYVTVNP